MAVELHEVVQLIEWLTHAVVGVPHGAVLSLET